MYNAWSQLGNRTSDPSFRTPVAILQRDRHEPHLSSCVYNMPHPITCYEQVSEDIGEQVTFSEDITIVLKFG